MTTPTGGESANLHKLEVEVREELTIAESQPLEDGDGVPTAELLMDPYAQRYEVSLRTVLGAIEAVEDGSEGGSPLPEANTPEANTPQSERPQAETRSGRDQTVATRPPAIGA